MEKELLIPFLKASIPEYDWILSDMEKSGGWLNLNENLIQNTISLKLEWWKAYEDEKLFNVFRLLMFLDPDEIKELNTVEKAEQVNEELTNDVYEFIQSDEYKELTDIKPFTEEGKKEIKKATEKWLAGLSEEETKKYWTDISHYWLGFFATFFDLLALMIQGKSMRQLVKEASNGIDASYHQAVQIDRTVLFLPYFQQRLLRAQLGM